MAFGAFKVLDRVSLDVFGGEIVGILGPNGAGKTTFMNLLTGAYRPTTGRVHVLGEDVTHLATADRCRRGIARTHQVPRPFGGMTVFENVLVAARNGRGDPSGDPVGLAWQVLEHTGLAGVANRKAGSLGLLDRKRLELSRALATGPRVVLLDEIGGGLTDAEADRLVALIRDIQRDGVTIVWIEHIMRLLTECCTRMICMAGGAVIADGLPGDVIDAPAVRTAYFGAAA
ncbi:ATP-binding cassette domain-containing protein [Pseudooceanicola sp. 216_PA32_1]|uniref:ATP-binding cassette domain-containing protein n=1 Tax=Pseudooceanicola pacificus TaxID=2676438 RepID=A0A844WAZ6_9RHOB|nr:ABC transporter ATP-binding protein [Pseudooceanicola pacificus]MWB78243.1 ATP-binding cassette domain-containing protein [Pseudooceanicola pacificus]